MKGKIDKAAENYKRYQYARDRGHKDYIKRHDECNDFFFDEQWDERQKKQLESQGRPALTINRIKPIILDMTGEFLANRADVKYVPSTGGDPEIAGALTKLYLHIQNEQDFREKECTLWMDGIITSRAYYDLRIGFDDNDQGEIRLYVPNPKNVIPDPDSDSKDPRDWNDVILLSHLTIQDIEMLYGPEKAKELKNAPNVYEDFDQNSRNEDTLGGPDFTAHHASHGIGDDTTQRLYFVIERQYKAIERVAFFVNQRTGDFRRVPPSWSSARIAEFLETQEDVEVERRRQQIVRWTVSCGHVLLHDDVSPFDEFTIIPWFPIFRRGKSSGAVDSLLDPQRNYNKQRSQELHIVNGTANAGWKVRRGSLTNMSIEELSAQGAKTGLVIEWDGENEKVIDRIQPVNIPQGVDRLSEKAERDLKSVSGIDDEARGVARGQTPGKAIQARRDAALISLSPYFESLAWTRKRLAQRVLKLVQKFYTEERHLRITGQDIKGEVQDLDVNTPQPDGTILNDLTVGEYDVVVIPTPLRETEEQEQFAQLRELQEAGWNIPVHLMVESSHLARKPEIVEEILRVNGMAEPSEEQQELERMMQELEMEEKKASIAARMAQAQLSQARAKKVLQEIELAQGDDAKLEELLLKARALDNERFRDEESMAIRRDALNLQYLQAGADNEVKHRQIDAQLETRKREAQQDRRSKS